MKKVLKITMSLLVVASFVFTSCKKEVECCTVSETDSTKICEDDPGMGLLWETTKATYELAGGTCAME